MHSVKRQLILVEFINLKGRKTKMLLTWIDYVVFNFKVTKNVII